MEEQEGRGGQVKTIISSIPNIVVKVITNPVGFFREMPKTGGYIEPLVFMIAMAVTGAVLGVVLSLFKVGLAGSFLMVIVSIVIVPVFVVIVGFVMAAIVFVIWKVMGSQESFETAFRCIAFTGAITPITVVLGIIPYIGTIIGLVWSTYLIVVASVEVHKIKTRTAWIVFGTICALFSLISLSAEYTARKFSGKTNQWQKMERKMGDIEKMTPEEAGKTVGEFLKGLEEGAKKGGE